MGGGGRGVCRWVGGGGVAHAYVCAVCALVHEQDQTGMARCVCWGGGGGVCVCVGRGSACI